ncbi:hypothetical protein tb265_46760 [Gemmatimonadetes bacterium T265]|nr:hypothetical protein tb265_46760 [Gemmatimonadetes bacterium T265]
MNLKRVLRVYRAEGLRLRKQRRRKQVSTPRRNGRPVPRPVHAGPNTQWTIDFISDQLADGRRFRVLSVVDECTRECLRLDADVSWPSARVAAALDDVVARRGAPQRVILDNVIIARSWCEGRRTGDRDGTGAGRRAGQSGVCARRSPAVRARRRLVSPRRRDVRSRQRRAGPRRETPRRGTMPRRSDGKPFGPHVSGVRVRRRWTPVSRAGCPPRPRADPRRAPRPDL